MIDLNILGVEGVTVAVPQVKDMTPEKTMHSAKKRYASQGAERVTLVPCRNGRGWKRKEHDKGRDDT